MPRRRKPTKQLGISNVEIERIARDVEDEGRPGATKIAAEVRAQMKPYRMLPVLEKVPGKPLKRRTGEDFNKVCWEHDGSIYRDGVAKPGFCELANEHRLADGSVLAVVRFEPYNRGRSSKWLLHYGNLNTMRAHLLIPGRVIDYRQYRSQNTRRGRRDPFSDE
jgi:hypothetical protein